jgi:hypothetical protein
LVEKPAGRGLPIGAGIEHQGSVIDGASEADEGATPCSRKPEGGWVGFRYRAGLRKVVCEAAVARRQRLAQLGDELAG